MVGKTRTEELSRWIFGENAHYGTPINPRAPGRVPGDSSSGSAAAVAAGIVDFALGTDTGGSVRVSASFCGIYAIRPTHGRLPLDGGVGQAPSFDTIGWFAREPDLLARIGEVLLDLDIGRAPRPRRLIVAADAFAIAEPATAATLGPAIERVGRPGQQQRAPRRRGDGAAPSMGHFTHEITRDDDADHGECASASPTNTSTPKGLTARRQPRRRRQIRSPLQSRKPEESA